MSENMDLSLIIEKRLPAEVFSFVQLVRGVAQKRGWNLYLVGGVVRDLLLGRATFDLDLAVEGNAIELARHVAQATQKKITAHARFGTAKLQWDQWSIDLTTCRSETYSRPGALPTVQPGSLRSDLFRRDFTVNAMAISLAPGRYGELIDLYGGRDDLMRRLIRVLHEKSFIDDATRIWRAIRYEQRLGFQLEVDTLRLLERDIAMLDTISGDRIWYELECILREERPETALRRAEELSVLQKLHPALKGDGWLAGKFDQARQLSQPDSPSVGFYLALLAYPLSADETENLISRLRLSKSLSRMLRDTISLKSKLPSLADTSLAPSRIYYLVHDYSSTALAAVALAGDSPVARRHIRLFLDKLRHIRLALNGDDLKLMGITPGPRIKELLARLFEAKLDGKLTGKEDEKNFIARLSASEGR